MARPNSKRFVNQYPMRVLQISGISLLTVGCLNRVFLARIGYAPNIALGISGFLLLWLSFKLWKQSASKPNARPARR